MEVAFACLMPCSLGSLKRYLSLLEISNMFSCGSDVACYNTVVS